MKAKILPLAVFFSVLGILPKVLRGDAAPGWLFLLFCYYLLVLTASYYLTRILWKRTGKQNYWPEFLKGLARCFIALLAFHGLLYGIQRDFALRLLNLGEGTPAAVVGISLLRAFIAHGIVFLWQLYQESTSVVSQPQNEPGPAKHADTVMAHYRNTLIPVPVGEIAFIHSTGGHVSQHLFSGKTYFTNKSLDQLEADLDPTLFFRANRQFLVHRRAVSEAATRDSRKLEAVLLPAAPEPVIISKAKAPAFRKWLGNG